MTTQKQDALAKQATGKGHGGVLGAFNAAANPPQPTQAEFFLALRSGSIEEIRDMIARKANVNAQDAVGDTPLILAVRDGRHDVVELLLESKADPNLKNYLLLHPLILAVTDKDEKMAVLLLEKGADPNAAADDDISTLIVAAEAGAEGIVRKLLEHKARPDFADNSGNTAAYSAVFHGQKGVLRILKEFKANLDMRNEEGVSLLDLVISKRRDDEMFDLLAELGADLLSSNSNNTSHVHRAAEANNDYALGKLVAAGADLTKADGRGHTPLISAAINGSGKAAKILLDQGVPLEGPHPDRHSPRRHAELKGHTHVVNLIDAEAGRRVQASIIADIGKGVKPGVAAPKRASFKKKQGHVP